MANLTIRLAGSRLAMKEEYHSLCASSVRKGPGVPLNMASIDVPILRGLGISSVENFVGTFVGSKVRRQPGEKVHVCVRCNFPIAVYGRLDPCEHVYCLMCAKLDPTCFLCDERVVRIQKMDVLEGIFICGAPCCLRSFFTRSEFESHVAGVHSQLLEEDKIPSVKSISMAISVSQSQTQLPLAGQNHAHMTGVQEPVSTLHVIFPKRQPQWKSPKSLWQHSENVVQPIPELQLPNQFPHHCAGNPHENSLNHSSGHDLDTCGRYQEQEWPLQILGQRNTEIEVERTCEGQSLERGGESVLNQSTQKRDDSVWQYASPREIQREHLLHQPTQYQPVTVPIPYSLPAHSPQSLQQEQSSFPSMFDSLWGFHPGAPIPFGFEYQENTSQLGNLTPSIGMQQGDRLMNINPQDGFYQVGPLRPLLDSCDQGVLPRPSKGNQQEIFLQNGPLLHFLNDFGLPLGIPRMNAISFQEGHLPLLPLGAPSKRAKCNGTSGHDDLVPGKVMMDHMRGPGNPGSFGGHPEGHAFQGKDN